MLLVRDIAMPLNFTGDQRRNESCEKRKFPYTRMGMAAQFRQAFLDAQHYAAGLGRLRRKRNPTRASRQRQEARTRRPKRDLKLEALLPYLQGKKTIVLAAEEPSDLETAVNLAQRIQSEVCAQPHQPLATRCSTTSPALKVPVIVGPIYEDPKTDERYRRGLQFAGTTSASAV